MLGLSSHIRQTLRVSSIINDKTLKQLITRAYIIMLDKKKLRRQLLQLLNLQKSIIIQPQLSIVEAISSATNVMGLIILPKTLSINVKGHDVVMHECHTLVFNVFNATKSDTFHLSFWDMR